LGSAAVFKTLPARGDAFIKTVHCPMALRVSDLATLPSGSPDRCCHGCKKTIRCLDGRRPTRTGTATRPSFARSPPLRLTP
jgi:hypothetical protein